MAGAQEAALGFFFNDTATTEIYTLSLHDALPILFPVLEGMLRRRGGDLSGGQQQQLAIGRARSEEHTSELQSREKLVCRLLLEKKKKRGRPDRRGSRG